jgi:hypothetical protein
MKIKKYILILLVLCSIQLQAQKSFVEGEWLLENIIDVQNNEIEEVAQILNFDTTGSLLIQERPFGTWSFENNKVHIDAEKIPGTYEVITISDQEMELSLDHKSLYFTKIDRTKMIVDNKNSSLLGVWKFKSQERLQELIEFKEPDNLLHIEMDDSYKGKHSGMWFYKPNTNELVIIGQIGNLNGINTVLSISNNEVLLVNKGNKYILKKAEQVTIERLDFLEEDFQNDTEDNLPWKDYYKMIIEMSKIKQLVYQYDLLEENTSTFETKLLTANVSTNTDNEILNIDNVFNGYDRFSLYEDQEFPENKYDNFKPLYPCTASSFKVIGEEEITVPAGVFLCTVVEAQGDFSTQLKIYMIKDKPGIIAKVISDNPDEYGHYAIYQLKEIQLN